MGDRDRERENEKGRMTRNKLIRAKGDADNPCPPPKCMRNKHLGGDKTEDSSFPTRSRRWFWRENPCVRGEEWNSRNSIMEKHGGVTQISDFENLKART